MNPAPHDELIARRIPGADDAAAEAARVSIRAKFAAIQADVEASSSAEELTKIVEQFKAKV